MGCDVMECDGLEWKISEYVFMHVLGHYINCISHYMSRSKKFKATTQAHPQMVETRNFSKV